MMLIFLIANFVVYIKHYIIQSFLTMPCIIFYLMTCMNSILCSDRVQKSRLIIFENVISNQEKKIWNSIFMIATFFI